MAIEKLDYEKCNDCGLCYEICPMDVFRRLGKTVYVAYPRDCMACFLCEMECPTEAIFVSSRRAKLIPFPY